MRVGVTAIPSSSSPYSYILPSKTHYPPCLAHRLPLSSSADLKLRTFSTTGTPAFPRITFRRNCSTGPGGENDSRSVLDAFFLGKAFAEALNERIESTVGEFLSAIGKLQSEQQKQVQEFQEEVLERAKREKEKAAREALETQGLVSESSTENITTVANGVTSKNTPSAAATGTPSIYSSQTSSTGSDANGKDPFLDLANDD